jgi:cobalt-zinc-cadmium efflux system outer membrane protein
MVMDRSDRRRYVAARRLHCRNVEILPLVPQCRVRPQLPWHRLAACLLALLATGCASTRESRTLANLDRAGGSIGSERGEEFEHGPAVRFSGELEPYVRYALKHSPMLRASYDEWRAATFRISPARQMPEPTISYAYFIQTVETRVGPQRHRFSISQSIPWPTKLTAGAEAATLAASSAERRYQAAGLAISRRVATAYWKKWRLRQTRKVLREQLEIIGATAGTARGRLEIGKGAIADVGQIELSRSRVHDVLSGLDEKELQLSADLVAAVGAPPGTKTPVDDEGPVLLAVAESDDALRQAVAEHPRLDALELMAESRNELADSAEASAWPSFMLGLTVIETGEAAMPNVPDSGKDPVIVSLSMKLPLWQGIYGDKADAARADGAAFRARRSGVHDDALAALVRTLSQLRDATRRVKLYQQTLLPQAEAVYGSVLAGYQTGETMVAATLLAERALLDLQLATFRARADHAVAWARLEELVGRAVKAKEVRVEQADVK